MPVRHFRNHQERKYADRDKGYIRGKRSAKNIPNSYDTQWIKVPRCWKDLYKKQCQYEEREVKTSYLDRFVMTTKEIIETYFYN